MSSNDSRSNKSDSGELTERDKRELIKLKEKELDIFEEENKIQREKNKNLRIIYIFSAILIFLLIIFLLVKN